MIGLPAGTKIWLAAGVTDMRAGMNGLAAKAQTALAEDPFSGHVFLFRGRRGDMMIKVLWWSGDGPDVFTSATGQAARARSLRLAAGRQRQRGVDAGAAIDAPRGHRLAPPRAHLASHVGLVALVNVAQLA